MNPKIATKEFKYYKNFLALVKHCTFKSQNALNIELKSFHLNQKFILVVRVLGVMLVQQISPLVVPSR